MAVQKKSTRTPTKSTETKIDFMKATNNIGKPIAAVAGFAVGKYALKKLTKSQTVTGLMGTEMKEYLVPAAVTMGGLIGTQFTKNQYIQLGHDINMEAIRHPLCPLTIEEKDLALKKIKNRYLRASLSSLKRGKLYSLKRFINLYTQVVDGK